MLLRLFYIFFFLGCSEVNFENGRDASVVFYTKFKISIYIFWTGNDETRTGSDRRVRVTLGTVLSDFFYIWSIWKKNWKFSKIFNFLISISEIFIFENFFTIFFLIL